MGCYGGKYQIKTFGQVLSYRNNYDHFFEVVANKFPRILSHLVGDLKFTLLGVNHLKNVNKTFISCEFLFP